MCALALRCVAPSRFVLRCSYVDEVYPLPPSANAPLPHSAHRPPLWERLVWSSVPNGLTSGAHLSSFASRIVAPSVSAGAILLGMAGRW